MASTIIPDPIRTQLNIKTLSQFLSLRTTTSSPFISPFQKRASVIIILRVRPNNDPLAITLPQSQYHHIYPDYYPNVKQPPLSLNQQQSNQPKTSTPLQSPLNSIPQPHLPDTFFISTPTTPFPPQPQYYKEKQQLTTTTPQPTSALASLQSQHKYPIWMAPLNHAKWLSQQWVQTGDIEVCFIKRAYNPRDRWSCQMGFPGGRQDKGESDLWTGIREVQEEIGLDLTNTRQFTFISRMDDIQVENMSAKSSQLSVSTFVFLQLTPVTPSLYLAPKEVSQSIWVPMRLFGLGTAVIAPESMGMGDGKKNNMSASSSSSSTQSCTSPTPHSNLPRHPLVDSSSRSTSSLLSTLWGAINPVNWFVSTGSALRHWIAPKYRCSGSEYIFIQHLLIQNIDRSTTSYELVYAPRTYLHNYIWRHTIDYVDKWPRYTILGQEGHKTTPQRGYFGPNAFTSAPFGNNHNNQNANDQFITVPLQNQQNDTNTNNNNNSVLTNVITKQAINDTTTFSTGWWTPFQPVPLSSSLIQQLYPSGQECVVLGNKNNDNKNNEHPVIIVGPQDEPTKPPQPPQLPKPQSLSDLLYLIGDVPVLPLKEFEHTTYMPRFRDFVTTLPLPQQKRCIPINPPSHPIIISATPDKVINDLSPSSCNTQCRNIMTHAKIDDATPILTETPLLDSVSITTTTTTRNSSSDSLSPDGTPTESTGMQSLVDELINDEHPGLANTTTTQEGVDQEDTTITTNSSPLLEVTMNTNNNGDNPLNPFTHPSPPTTTTTTSTKPTTSSPSLLSNPDSHPAFKVMKPMQPAHNKSKSKQPPPPPTFPIPIRFPCLLLSGVGLRTIQRLPNPKTMNKDEYERLQQMNQIPMMTMGTPETMLWGLTFRNIANFTAVMLEPLLRDVIEYDNEYRRYVLNLYIRYNEWWWWAFGGGKKKPSPKPTKPTTTTTTSSPSTTTVATTTANSSTNQSHQQNHPLLTPTSLHPLAQTTLGRAKNVGVQQNKASRNVPPSPLSLNPYHLPQLLNQYQQQSNVVHDNDHGQYQRLDHQLVREAKL